MALVKPDRLEKVSESTECPSDRARSSGEMNLSVCEHVSRGLAAAADINHEYSAVCLNINSLYFCIFIIWFDVMNRLCPRP